MTAPPGARYRPRHDLLRRFSMNLIAVALSLALLSQSTAPGRAAPERAAPERFSPGVISSGNVYRGSFAPDGRTFYFFKKVVEGAEDYRIFVSRLAGDAWTTPERFLLGGEHSDMYPAITPDGRRMIFSSYRPAPGATAEKPNANLWYADRKGDGWGEPVFMAEASVAGTYHSWVHVGRRGGTGAAMRRPSPSSRSSAGSGGGRTFASPVEFPRPTGGPSSST
jgi:hypothetical protein